MVNGLTRFHVTTVFCHQRLVCCFCTCGCFVYDSINVIALEEIFHSTSRITDMENCIFTFVFEQLVVVELDEKSVAANRSPCCGTTIRTTLHTCWKTSLLNFRQADGQADVDGSAVEYERAEGCNQTSEEQRLPNC